MTEERETEARILASLGRQAQRDQEWRDKLVVAISENQPATTLVGISIGLMMREGDDVQKDLARRIGAMVQQFTADAQTKAGTLRSRLLAGTSR